MLVSIAVILLSGMVLGNLCRKVRFPALFGMIIAGIVIGPGVLDLIDPSILNISSEIRRIALIIILIRAGLKLELSDLKKAGRPAVLMCFLPACFEMAGMILLAPKLLGMSVLDAAILGAVIAAVSPAVIVPRMIRLIDEGYGKEEGIPQMILAGASVDDVFVIVMFTSFTELARGGNPDILSIAKIPVSIAFGISAGFVTGYLLHMLFQKTDMSLVVKTLVILSTSFLLSGLETGFPSVPFASLIAVMCAGMALRRKDEKTAAELSWQYDRMWTAAEVFLFVLVGASVSLEHALKAGMVSVILVLLVLLFRMLGVYVCLTGSRLEWKERLFCMIAYTPKATVQAAIGGLPLAMGLACGETVLTVSVISILLSAPLGAFGIDLTYRRFLKKKDN